MINFGYSIFASFIFVLASLRHRFLLLLKTFLQFSGKSSSYIFTRFDFDDVKPISEFAVKIVRKLAEYETAYVEDARKAQYKSLLLLVEMRKLETVCQKHFSLMFLLLFGLCSRLLSWEDNNIISRILNISRKHILGDQFPPGISHKLDRINNYTQFEFDNIIMLNSWIWMRSQTTIPAENYLLLHLQTRWKVKLKYKINKEVATSNDQPQVKRPRNQ
ncbi:hypothetical protein CHUAL_011378, partial [Chamberlinius hualienensis]